MHLRSWLLALGVIIAGGACDSSVVDPITYTADGLRATVAPPQLTIENESGQRISYMVMEAELAARALISLSGWPTIEPFGQVSLPYSAIGGYDPDRENEALISWAPAPATPGGPVAANNIKVLRVRL